MSALQNETFLEKSIIGIEPDPRIRKRSLSVYRQIHSLPIIDPHTHYPSEQISDNTPWQDPTMLFLGVPGLGFDHYVGRLMLAEGVDPLLVYGREDLRAPPPDRKFNRERFTAMIAAFAAVPLNSSSLWFKAALEEVFHITHAVTVANTPVLWEELSDCIRKPHFYPQSILESAKVKVALTTDDPVASLSEHELHRESTSAFTMLPTWRADAVLYLSNKGRYNFDEWLDTLEKTARVQITSLQSLLNALIKRMDYFADNGCIASDLGIDNFRNQQCTKTEASNILLKRLDGRELELVEIYKWQSFMLRFLSLENARRRWVQFFHQGPVRDENSMLFQLHGADIGGDGPGETIDRNAFIGFMDGLHSTKLPGSIDGTGLAKTVLFPINRSDYEFVLDTVAGFCENSVAIKSKVQLGPPWWFNDTVQGNAEVIGMICDRGNIGNWIGMLSDARSLPPVIARIKQFRAVLAVELSKRTLYESEEYTLALAQKISFQNAVDFFGIEL